MKYFNNLLIVLVLCTQLATAQEKSKLGWYNPAKEAFLTVHNQLWNNKEIKNYYDRLLAKAQQQVRKEVWALSGNAAGLKLVFNTNAQEIVVRYTTSKSKSSYAMSHFPATGVSGLDLYAENIDGTWAWANSTYSFKDTITYTYSALTLDRAKYKNGRNFHLYLPLYNGVKWLEIGVPAGSTFKFIPVSAEKPIIVYGTSIAQGGCASRPGMAWTNLLERALHTPVANLGFSDNGRLEKEVVDLIAEKDARTFILDCLPNLVRLKDSIDSRMRYAVHTIRAKHPLVPIILTDHSGHLDNRMNTARAGYFSGVSKESWRVYQELKSQGIKNLYYLKHEDIGLDINDSVDGTHPTDMGMLKYAKAYEKLIRTILK